MQNQLNNFLTLFHQKIKFDHNKFTQRSFWFYYIFKWQNSTTFHLFHYIYDERIHSIRLQWNIAFNRSFSFILELYLIKDLLYVRSVCVWVLMWTWKRRRNISSAYTHEKNNCNCLLNCINGELLISVFTF